MQYKYFMDLALKYQIRMLRWPFDVPAPGPDFDPKKRDKYSLERICHVIIVPWSDGMFPHNPLFDRCVNIFIDEKLLAHDKSSVEYAKIPLVIADNNQVLRQVSDACAYVGDESSELTSTKHTSTKYASAKYASAKYAAKHAKHISVKRASTKRVQQRSAPSTSSIPPGQPHFQPVGQDAVQDWGAVVPFTPSDMDEMDQLLSEYDNQDRSDYPSQWMADSTVANGIPSQLHPQMIVPSQLEPHHGMPPTVRQMSMAPQASSLRPVPMVRQAPSVYQAPYLQAPVHTSQHPMHTSQPPMHNQLFPQQMFIQPNHPSYNEHLRRVRDYRRG
jgi:hypothetical protein